jgi:hypothetical protein
MGKDEHSEEGGGISSENLDGTFSLIAEVDSQKSSLPPKAFGNFSGTEKVHQERGKQTQQPFRGGTREAKSHECLTKSDQDRKIETAPGTKLITTDNHVLEECAPPSLARANESSSSGPRSVSISQMLDKEQLNSHILHSLMNAQKLNLGAQDEASARTMPALNQDEGFAPPPIQQQNRQGESSRSQGGDTNNGIPGVFAMPGRSHRPPHSASSISPRAVPEPL